MSSPSAMVERWRCLPSTRGAGPVERNWEGLGASRCRDEQDALAGRCRKARWHAGHTRSDGAPAGEEGEGEQGLTVRYQALGGLFHNGEERAGLGEGGIEEWRVR